MAQVENLDEGLAQLEQLFVDTTLVIRIMRERIAGVDRLREPLKVELDALQGLINRVMPLGGFCSTPQKGIFQKYTPTMARRTIL